MRTMLVALWSVGVLAGAPARVQESWTGSWESKDLGITKRTITGSGSAYTIHDDWGGTVAGQGGTTDYVLHSSGPNKLTGTATKIKLSTGPARSN